MMFYKETEFQDSPIGKVPRDWDVRELGDERIAKIIAGQSPPSSTYSRENHGLPFLQGKTEFGEVFPSPTVYCSKPIKVAQESDILLSVRAPVGDVNIAPFECCIGRGIAAIRPRTDKLASMFLFHFLRLEGRRFEALSTGSTFKAIRRKEIEKFQVPVPSSIEQRAIIGVLGVVDSAVEFADKVIAKTERLKKGLMQQLLTQGIGHTEHKDTPIGKTPKTWTAIQLRDLISEVKNGFASGKRDENGIVQVRMNNITTDGRLVLDSYLKVPTPENMDMWLLKTDDFLFNNTNSIDLVGKSAIFEGAPFPCTFSNHFTRIRFKENLVRPELILYHFITQWEKGYFKSVAIRHVGQAAVHTEYLLRLKIPLPPLGEQKKIVEIISIASRKLELERGEKTKLERIKSGLMDLLLTGKVRIKVD